jgi:hypothetical protein
MGWYVKTEQQLRDSGWTNDDAGFSNYFNSGYYFASDMKGYCGTPYLGAYPAQDDAERWNGWYWNQAMLVWIEE